MERERERQRETETHTHRERERVRERERATRTQVLVSNLSFYCFARELQARSVGFALAARLCHFSCLGDFRQRLVEPPDFSSALVPGDGERGVWRCSPQIVRIAGRQGRQSAVANNKEVRFHFHTMVT